MMVTLFASAQGNNVVQRDLVGNGSRPLAIALDELMMRYPGIVVTYEDPRYRYSGDVQDITSRCRGISISPASPRVLVPRERSFATSYQVLADNEEPVNGISGLLASIVASYNTSNNATAGDFCLEQVGEIFHVVPNRARNVDSTLVRDGSVLDSHISLDLQEVDGLEALARICIAVSNASGQDISLGVAPLNLLGNTRVSIEATDEPARSVLTRFLTMFGPQMTWALNFGPDVKRYGLNMRVIGQKQDDYEDAERRALRNQLLDDVRPEDIRPEIREGAGGAFNGSE